MSAPCRHHIRTGGALVLAVLILWAATVAAQFVDQVLVRAGNHDGYGRIVLQWPQPVTYNAEIIGDQLILRFDRPFDADPAAVLGPISDYVGDAFVDPSQNAIAFILRDAFDVRAFPTGSSVVIDILDIPEPEPEPVPEPTPQPEPAPAPPPPAQQAATPAAAPTQTVPAPPQSTGVPTLGVRVGTHPTYRRVVFDWPQRVGYSMAPEASSANLQFQAPARIDLAALNRSLPSGIRAEVSSTEPLQMRFTYPDGTTVRHFRSGPKLVVDLGRPAAPRPAQPQQTVAAPSPAPAPPPQVADVQEESAAPDPPDAAPETAVTPPPPVETAPDEQVAADAQELAEADGPVSLLPGELEPKTSSGTLVVGIEQDADHLSLLFPFDGPSAAAVWQRAGFMWVVFDRLVTLDFEQVRSDQVAAIGIIEQMENPYGTVARFTTGEGIAPVMIADGDIWQLRLQLGELRPLERIGPTIDLDENTRARLYVPVDTAMEVIPVDDPEVGDAVLVTPIELEGTGVEFPLTYPELQILTTHQGVVVAPIADGIDAVADGAGVAITGPDGLQISPEGATLLASATGVREEHMEVDPDLIFDLDGWGRGGLASYPTEIRRLRRAVVDEAKNGDEHRNKARMEIARYYFANGLGPEAKGILNLMEKDDPLLTQEVDFLALRGGVNFLTGDLEQAANDLNHPKLDEIKEVQLWRAATNSAAGSPARAAADLLASADLLETYPPELLVRLSPLLAETALKTNNAEGGRAIVDQLLDLEIPDAKRMDALYLLGLLQQDAGEFDAAISTWDEVADGRNRKARAHAISDRTELLLRLRRLSPLEAIEQLDKLRYAWRGDDFELALLRRLGQLHIANNDYRNGLKTLREAATFFPGHPQTSEITQEMNDAFKNLYLGDGADNLPPITAIALYDEFRELTPSGAEGDEMIRRLADRLVEVDLLSRAAELLEHQVAFRLEGEEKARVGARLAYVYLRDNQPQETLRVLDESVAPNLPPELDKQRRHLRSQALMTMGRPDEAVALLADDMTEDAERLRIEVFHENKNWLEKALALERLIGDPGAMFENFTDQDARNVLDWVSALALAGDERQLQRVRRRFGAMMAQTPFKDAFQLITSPQERGLPDYRTLTSKLREVESFKSFMDVYRERLEDGKLSTIN